MKTGERSLRMTKKPSTKIPPPPRPPGKEVWLERTYDFMEWTRWVEAKGEPSWILKDFIINDGVTLISGAPKAGLKTWLAFSQALVIASGQNKFGFRPTDGAQKVWFVEMESPETPTVHRFRSIANGMENSLEELTSNLIWSHIPSYQLNNLAHIKRMCQFVEQEQVKVIFIDTLGKASGTDENSNTEMNQVFRNLDRFKALGCSVVIIHHVTKGAMKEDWKYPADSVLRGASAIAGAYDVHIHVRKPDPEKRTTVILERISKEGPTKYFKGQWWIQSDDEGKPTRTNFDFEEIKGLEQFSERDLDQYYELLMPQESYGIDALKEIWNVKGRKEAREIAETLKERGDLKYGRKKYYKP